MHKCIHYILSILILFLGMGLKNLVAQVKVQVVSQEITESVEWKEGMTLELNGERAEIYITSHPHKTIDFEVTFVAKHENRTTAESDIKKMKWIFEPTNNKIFLRNYIELNKNESKPDSDIKTIYHIKIPEKCEVDISNYFGKIKIENLNFKLKINSEFSPIDLQNISGKISIKSTFGDISANRIKGDIGVESNRSDITLSNISGNLDLHSNLAEIRLSGIKEIIELKINADKSKINLKFDEINSYHYYFDLSNTELDIPDEMKLEYIKNENDEIKAHYNKTEELVPFEIKLNIGSITIE